MQLQNKRIVLGVTGGIAAYKIAELVRLFKKNGAEVRCVMTPVATDFVTPLTLATLSENPVGIDFWNSKDGTWTNHVELGMWGDIMVIAPLTANTLSKMVYGGCDNLLLATYLSAKCPVLVAPAMDLDMYAHPSTIQNLETLVSRNVMVLPAEEGFLASGLTGKGRMVAPASIYNAVCAFFEAAQELKGKHILVTAGPTYEPIDPVRFVGNNSSGKMGFALAKELLYRGAKVTMVVGPSAITLAHNNLFLKRVTTAQEMFEEVKSVFSQCDGGIFAAAVSDYRPDSPNEQKIKKQEDEMVLKLVKNPDILKWCGEHKQHQWLCGFALETNDAIAHGRGKLERKNADVIVVNTLEDEGAGFGHDTNRVTLLAKDNKQENFELTTKEQVAKNIINFIIKNII